MNAEIPRKYYVFQHFFIEISAWLWYNLGMKEDILTTEKSDTVVISREEYDALVALKTQYATMEKQIKWLTEQVTLNRQKQFGASSEKSEYDFSQVSIFNEAEHFADEKAEEPKLTKIKEYYRKTRLTTDKLPLDLPEEVIDYELPPEERICPECGEKLHEIGSEVIREELRIIPASMSTVKHVRHTYGCRCCEKHSEKATIVKAPVAAPVIKGSFASPEAVAHIMVQKYVMGSPLYRQEKEMARQGIPLSRQTMSNWTIKCSEDWLEPIYELLHRKLIEHTVLAADETELQVLREPGKTAQSKSYLWVYRTGSDAEHPIALSEYQPDRRAKRPIEFLNGFKGYLHTDGYDGYHKLPEDITVVGCWSHARRYYDQALKTLSEKDREGTNALRGKRYCDKLFAIEKKLTDCSPDERYKKRLELAKPVLDEYHNWLLSFGDIGKNLFGKAVNYSLSQWKYLENYLLDGRLEISNNRTERTVKPFVIDRKNFLFSNTPRGAKASAVVFSLIETAIENGLNPFDYLVYVFKNAPNWDIHHNEANLTLLLPENVPDYIKAPAGKVYPPA